VAPPRHLLSKEAGSELLGQAAITSRLQTSPSAHNPQTPPDAAHDRHLRLHGHPPPSLGQEARLSAALAMDARQLGQRSLVGLSAPFRKTRVAICSQRDGHPRLYSEIDRVGGQAADGGHVSLTKGGMRAGAGAGAGTETILALSIALEMAHRVVLLLMALVHHRVGSGGPEVLPLDYDRMTTRPILRLLQKAATAILHRPWLHNQQ